MVFLASIVSFAAYSVTIALASEDAEEPWTYRAYHDHAIGAVHGHMLSPMDWQEAYAECAGSYQSPIDLEVDTATECELGKTLTFNGHCDASTLSKTSGAYKWGPKDGFCSVMVDDESYDFAQFHVHMPSEHTLDGKYFDGEFHFVHQNEETGNIVVVGLFVSESDGKDYEEAEWVKPVFQSIQDGVNSTAKTTDMTYADLIKSQIDYSGVFNYRGSLTTPPCSEVVNWFVVKEAMQVNATFLADLYAKQLALESADYGHNSRPLQGVNERSIKLLK